MMRFSFLLVVAASCGRSSDHRAAPTQGGSGSAISVAAATVKEDMMPFRAGGFRGRTALCPPDSLQPISPAAEGSDRHGISVDLNVAAFAIDKRNVACSELRVCEEAHACKAGSLPAGCTGDVALATWSEATSFCNWRKGTLPSLYEWQRAVRGAAGDPYPWGTEPRDVTCATEGADAACHFMSKDGVNVRVGPKANVEWTRDTDCGRNANDESARLPLVVDTRAYRLDELETEDPGATRAAFRCVKPAI